MRRCLSGRLLLSSLHFRPPRPLSSGDLPASSSRHPLLLGHADDVLFRTAFPPHLCPSRSLGSRDPFPCCCRQVPPVSRPFPVHAAIERGERRVKALDSSRSLIPFLPQMLDDTS